MGLIDQGDLFHENIAFINPKGLDIILRPMLQEEIPVEKDPVPQGEFVFDGKEFFDHDKPEIRFRIIRRRSIRPDMQIEFFLPDKVFDDLLKIKLCFGLDTKSTMDRNLDHLIINEFSDIVR
jgi:hypothetical protein